MSADLAAPPAPQQSTDAPIGPARSSYRPNASWIILAIAAVLWLLSLISLGRASLSQFGLLVSGSPLFLASILIATLGFVTAVRARRFAAAAGAVVLTVMIERLTGSIITEVPLYSWTYKHIGVVDYIQQNGSLAHGVDIYQGWPGLFALTAWFSRITGIDAVDLAHWFTPVVHLAMAGLMYAVARVWKLGPFPALVAAFLVEVFNWVGQDYFSPQATALVLAMGLLILLGLSQHRATATPLALLIFAAIVVTHQLTPYWLIILCLGLLVVRRSRPRWLAVAMIAITGAYLAFNFGVVQHFTLLSFDLFQNVQSNIHTVGVLGQRVTSAMVRALALACWFSTLLCLFILRRRQVEIRGVAVLAASSFVLLGGQSYGGEAIFRVFLYALPGCCLAIAPVLTDVLGARLRWTIPMAVVLMGCVTASAQGYFGGWFANLMSRTQVIGSEEMFNTIPLPSYLTVAAPVWPERSTGRYVDFLEWTQPGEQQFDYPMIYETKLFGTHFASDSDYDTFIKAVSARSAPTYLIITRQMAIYDWYYGLLPIDALSNLQQRMQADPRWTVYQHTDEYVIFKSTSALIGAN